MTRAAQVRAERAQRITVMYAVMACLALLVGVQWILLSVAVEGFHGGRGDLLVSTSVASGLCFGAACWLFRHAVPPADSSSPVMTEAQGRWKR